MNIEQSPDTQQNNFRLLDRLKHAASDARKVVGRIAISGLLLAGSTLAAFTAEESVNPEAAAAETGSYPWADAEHVPQPPARDDITWGYKDKNTCDEKSEAYNCGTYKEGEYFVYDQWGYYLDNCTSFAAWYLAKQFGVNASGLGTATKWNNNAPSKGWVIDQKPGIGDVAHWEGNDSNPAAAPGHVAIVVGVNPDGSVNVDEYNHNWDGKFGHRNNVRATNYIDDEAAKLDIKHDGVPGLKGAWGGHMTLSRYTQEATEHGMAQSVASYLEASRPIGLAIPNAIDVGYFRVNASEGFVFRIFERFDDLGKAIHTPGWGSATAR